MNAQTISNILDVLAAKLSVPAKFLWATLLRQVYVDAITDGLWLVACVAVVVVLAKVVWPKAVKYDDDEFDGAARFFTICGMVVATALSLVMLTFIAEKLINPDYYALKAILDTIGGAK